MAGIAVERSPQVLHPDPRRIVGRPYVPGDDPTVEGQPRLEGVVQRILAVTDDEVASELADVRGRFNTRHRSLERMLLRNSERVAHLLNDESEDRRLLVGAYLTHEYAFEAAALTNPSVVCAPDQSDLPEDVCRFVLSLRSIGEGHLSSIQFRTGTVDADGGVELDAVGLRAETGERRTPVYERKLFGVKLAEIGADVDASARVLDQLPRHFGVPELDQALAALDDLPRALSLETAKFFHWLASSNYLLVFDEDTALEERLLWPEGPLESRGMEDARFVHFAEDDRTTTYYATYTAFDGIDILPQLIETNDFRSFEISTLNGRSAQNKGMALFPRTIDGAYFALSRPDRENIHLLRSDNPRFWNAPSVPLRGPKRPWELIQMGNCGSPLETSEGWLVLTHGVGPMRTYRLGALLLDIDDPARIIADLPVPLLEANETERDGYVPNVVYSCGGMIHGDRLVLPYGFSDQGTGIAVLSVPELLKELLAHPASSAR
ncbi:MAG: glycoside hydrolase family 130 protein [Acidimicrobiales bacterium]